MGRYFVALLLVGCVKSSSVLCDDGNVCVEGDRCDAVHHLCVPGDAFMHCMGVADGAACTFDDGAPGTCFDEVCLPAACGNRRIDADEQCDTADADTSPCSADCKSTLTCGNAVSDAGEECDDGNVADHDGCSSRCIIEGPHWIRHPRAPNDGVAYASAGFDGAHPVLFGGLDATGTPTTDTWVWAGTWSRVVTSVHPPGVLPGPRFAWDLGRKTGLLYGNQSQSANGGLWLFDGMHWSRQALAPDAFVPDRQAMTWDATRNAVISVGGRAYNGALFDDTVAWDGTQWSPVATSARPAPVELAGLTFDTARQTSVLFGGFDQSHIALDTTYELDTDWHPRNTSTKPSARGAVAMAYDAASQRTILFGGATGLPFNPGNAIGETWAWNGTTWAKLTTASTPPPRAGGVLEPDGQGRLLLVGGESSPSSGTGSSIRQTLPDTWVFDNGEWSEQLLPVRSFGNLASDRMTQTAILQGGRDTSNFAVDETWQLSQRGWKKLPATGPGKLTDAAIAYDEDRHVFVMFGGFDATANQPVAETWTFDGATWMRKPLTTVVPPMEGARAAFDPISRRVIMFGGLLAGNAESDKTYAWDGSAWSLVATSGPAARVFPAVGADPVRKEIVLFGGQTGVTFLDDTWIWDGTTWKPGSAGPAGSAAVALAWNPARQRLTLYESAFNGGQAWEWNDAWVSVDTPEPAPAGYEHAGCPSLDGGGVSFIGRYAAKPTDLWEIRWEPLH